MAIVNRDLDVSQQREALPFTYQNTATGLTLQAVIVPYASTLNAVGLAPVGLSGTPAVDLRVWRFIVGTGVTTIAGGATTLTLTAVGTSGVNMMVLAASGSSFLNLLAKDIITLTTSGSNAALAQLGGEVVITAIQDIRSTLGV